MAMAPVNTRSSPSSCENEGKLRPAPASAERLGDPERARLSELGQCAADLIVASTGVDLSGVALFDSAAQPGQGPDPPGAKMIAASHYYSRDWESLVVRPGDGIAGKVLSLGGGVAIKNYEMESGSSAHLIEVFSHFEYAYAMLAVPIQRGGTILGVVYGGLRRPEYIGDRGRVGLYNVAKLFASAAFGETQAGTVLDPSQTQAEANADLEYGPFEALTERELQVLQLLGEGLSSRDIAAREYLAVNTVRSYVQSTLWKLNAHSRLQAVAKARRLHLIDPGPASQGRSLVRPGT